MKNITITAFLPLLIALAFTSCENEDISFGDYDYQTIYFARQSPIRTITLGEDIYSTDLDNEHRFQVYARLGGVESNKKDRLVNFVVDDSMCDGLYYDDGTQVRALPESYYQLGSSTITIPKGEASGCVDVQLTDAFFADTLSTFVTYVLPLRITSASDSILSGEVKDGVDDPNIVNTDDWDVQPMNYTLYAVKFKNKYTGCWLSEGTDVITVGGVDSTVDRMAEYWEYADLVYLTTTGLETCRYEVSDNLNILGTDGKISVSTQTCSLILTFDADGDCVITTDTPGCTATGTGAWTYHGLEKAWNQTDRDELQLNYTLTYTFSSGGETVTATRKTTETLCMRDRESKLEDFSYTVTE